jgi:hypothetical protein
MTTITVQLQSNTGAALPAPPPISGDYVLKERGVGTLTLTYPPTIPPNYLQKDGRVILSYNGASEGGTWLIRRVNQTFQNRERLIAVTCVHANHLLGRRTVAYAAGSAQASKSGPADDLMKAIVRENLTAPTDATRTMSATYGITSVAADTGAGPTVAKSFSRQNVLKVLQDLADLAAAQGTYVGFEVRSISGALTFLTYTQQRGADRRATSGNYLDVRPSSGAISESALDYNWTDEVTYIYAVGMGTEAARAIGTAQNAAAESASPIGRVEGTYQDNSTDDTAILDDDAAQQLYTQRARIRYEARAQDTPGFIYNRDYGWGDFLTVTDFGQTFDVRVDPVHVTWGRDGIRLDNRFIYDSTGVAL